MHNTEQKQPQQEDKYIEKDKGEEKDYMKRKVETGVNACFLYTRETTNGQLKQVG